MRNWRAFALLGVLLPASGEATAGIATALPIVSSAWQPRQPLAQEVDRRNEVSLFPNIQLVAAGAPAEARLPRPRPTEKDGLDGVARWTYSDSKYIPNEPMYFLANLAVGGNWPGDPDSETVFPAEFLLDYVRIWRRATS